MARVVAAVAMFPVVLGEGSLRANMNTNNLHVAGNALSRSLAGFMELGCYKDSRSRIFQKSMTTDSLDTTVCANYCSDYPYYGLQNGNECWCGEYDSRYARYGEAINECVTACSGNDGINCGGRYAMQVFSQAEEDSDALGCVKDDMDRVFTDKITASDMSPEDCQKHCSSKGKYYYGTQYGHECWCGEKGTDYNKYGPATCDRPCSGDPMTICGGSYAMTVYLTGDAPTTQQYPCYADDKEDRVGLNMIANSTMSYKTCMHHCNGHDAAWAMVQYGKECFCGYEDTVIDRLGSATCNYKCEGEPLQTCGGRNAFNAIRL